ncbi:flavin reductase family protein [Nocardia beijingensis]|uniref:flavin reductase family protein n=1 Tax=Nocardia beijingensis TaxID=95162 RepID=UPI00340C1414
MNDRDGAGTSFRELMGHFPSGLTIVTGLDEGAPAGFTCQSFFSVSLTPELVAFSVRKESATFPALRAGGRWAVNVLSAAQVRIGHAFGRPGDRFAGVAWRPGLRTDCPILDGALAWMECVAHTEVAAGDHDIVISRVVNHGVGEGFPLLYFKGRYARLDPVS